MLCPGTMLACGSDEWGGAGREDRTRSQKLIQGNSVTTTNMLVIFATRQQTRNNSTWPCDSCRRPISRHVQYNNILLSHRFRLSGEGCPRDWSPPHCLSEIVSSEIQIFPMVSSSKRNLCWSYATN